MIATELSDPQVKLTLGLLHILVTLLLYLFKIKKFVHKRYLSNHKNKYPQLGKLIKNKVKMVTKLKKRNTKIWSL